MIVFGSTSCAKEYAAYANMEIVEVAYSGLVSIPSVGANPGGDFEGKGDSGIYSFVWSNPSKIGALNYAITTSSGSVQFILREAVGREVLNETRTANGDNTFSGSSSEGRPGNWLAEIRFTGFNGDGRFSLTPVEY